MIQLTILISIFLLISHISAQQTGLICADNIATQGVPAGSPIPLDFWSGTWYTIGTCAECTSPDNVCTQVQYAPTDGSNPATTLTYIGSFNSGGQPSSPLAQATGVMTPQDMTQVNYPYQFDLPLETPDGPRVVNSRFWVLAASNFDDDGNPTAIVTYSCGLPAGQDGDTDNAQIFFLSRKPFFNDGVTFQNLATLASNAIGANNYNLFNITTVSQQQNWCNYALDETPIDFDDSMGCDDDIDTAVTFSKAATGLSAVILALVLGLLGQLCMGRNNDNPGRPTLSAK